MPESMILEALTGNDAGLQIIVPASGAILGRGSDCDVTLREPTLSRKHCRIVCENGEWVIQDLGSRCGVIVNDAKVGRRSLGQGDVVRLGSLQLRVTTAPVESIPQPTGDKLIRFKCQCGKRYAVKDTLAGKAATCKQCGAKVTVPTMLQLSQPLQDAETPRDIPPASEPRAIAQKAAPLPSPVSEAAKVPECLTSSPLQDSEETKGVTVSDISPAPASKSPPPLPYVPPPPLGPPISESRAEWRVVINGVQQGVYSVSQVRQRLQEGSIPRDTLCWREGMTDWQRADLLPTFRDISAGVPPLSPVADAAGEGNLAHQATKQCPFCAEVILAKARKCKHCGGFLDGVSTSLPIPERVRYALILLYSSLAIGIVSFALELPDMVSQGYVNSPISKEACTVIALVTGLVMFAILFFIILMINKGRNWARITYLVLFVIGIPFVVAPLVQIEERPIRAVVYLGQLALEGVALVWLFQRSSSQWFRPQRGRSPDTASPTRQT